MGEKRAARLRAASRWIGYLGVAVCAAAGAIWYIVNVVIGKDPVKYLQLSDRDILPVGLLPMIGGALFCIVVAIILRVLAARAAKAYCEPLSDDDGDEDLTAAEQAGEGSDESVYEEEPLPAIGEADAPASLPAPAGETAAASAPAPAAEEAKSGRVIASLEVRVPSDPTKDAMKAAKKAKRAQSASKVKAALRRTTEKALPPEKREALKKKAETVKKAAKIIIPVAITCVVVAKIAKKRREKKRAKERARNRQQFYQWLG